MLKIYHNPRCSKSRGCLAFLETLGQPFEVVKYMENPLSENEVRHLIDQLNIAPIELVRRKESLWIEHYKHKDLSADEIITILANHPVLIERPIVLNGNKAVIARPIENVADIV